MFVYLIGSFHERGFVAIFSEPLIERDHEVVYLNGKNFALKGALRRNNMTNKTFIFGAGALAQVLFYHLEKAGCAPDGFVVDDTWYKGETSICGLPLVPFSSMEKRFPPTKYGAYVAIGYGKMNAGRQDVFYRLRSMGYWLPNYIHPSVINDTAVMGEGNLIFAGTMFDSYSELGDGNMFYPAVMIGHGCKIGNFNFFSGRTALAGDVVVGNRCFFGLNCSVTNGLVIPDRCLIGAGAFASVPLTEGCVLAAPRSVLLEKDSEMVINRVMKK